MTQRQAVHPPGKIAGNNHSADLAWRVAGIAFCLLMLGVHVAVGLNSAGVPDSWRDMYWATSIAHGEHFPVSGPPIYRLFELGPWWFYVVALPIWVTGKIAVASAFVQLLAGAKYFLALRLGTRAVDARFGFAFAASLAVAGWSTASGMFPTHTAVVETALLLLAMATWRCWDRLSLGNAALLGLAAVACVHAHPTTAFHVVCAGLFLLFRHRSWRALAFLGCAAAIVILSVLPPWFDPSTVASLDRKPIATYVGGELGVDLGLRIPALLKSLTVGGAWFGFLLMTKWSLATAKFAWWAYCGCLLFALAGAVRLRRTNRKLTLLFAGALALFLGDVAFLASIRPITPIWMVPSTLPPLALVTAVGWYGWLGADQRALRMVAAGALALFVALSLAPFGLLLRDIPTMRVASGINPYLDIIGSPERYISIPAPFVPARRLDRLSGALCGPAVLHGRLAAAVEQSLGSTIRNACGHWPELRYGGLEGPGPHLTGILAYGALATGIEPTRVVAGMALYERQRPIAPTSGGHPTRLKRMQVNPDAPSGELSRIVYDFDARGGDVPLLTSRLPAAAPVSARVATADGRGATVVYDDGAAWAYRCASCVAGAPVHWHVEFVGIEQGIDLVVLLGGSSGTDGAQDAHTP